MLPLLPQPPLSFRDVQQTSGGSRDVQQTPLSSRGVQQTSGGSRDVQQTPLSSRDVQQTSGGSRDVQQIPVSSLDVQQTPGSRVLYKILTSLEEIKQTQKVHSATLQRILAQLQMPEDDTPELPEGVAFPLCSMENVTALEDKLTGPTKKRLVSPSYLRLIYFKI